jgi:hypothetical protein
VKPAPAPPLEILL